MVSDSMREYVEQLYEQSLKLMESPETINEAIEKLELILKVDPDNAKANYYLGKALILNRKPEEAIEYLKKAKDHGYNDDEIDDLLDKIHIITEKKKLEDQIRREDLVLSEAKLSENIILGQYGESEKEPPFSFLKKRMGEREKIHEIIVIVFITIIVSYFSRNFLTKGYLLGWDSMSHVFKSWFAMESLLGRSSFDWCEYWYQGSPIMAMYAPLFYLSSALFGIITRLNALEASKWIVFLSYPMSALSFYYFTKSDNIDIASISGAILYGLIPWHFTYVTILGNPTYTMCYLFLPPLFKFLKGYKLSELFLSSISFSLTTISHQGTGFLLAYALIWYHLFSGLLKRELKKSIKKLVIIGAISVGLLSFFWIPYLYYSNLTSSFEVPFQPMNEVVQQLLYQNHFMYLGSPIIVILLVATAVVLVSKDREGITYALLTLLSLIITFGYTDPTVQIIYPLARLIGPGYRFNILTSFTVPMILYHAVKETPNLLKKYKIVKLNSIDSKKTQYYLLPILVITIIFTISAVLPISNYNNIPIPDSHSSIFSIIFKAPEEGRVWWLPRGALETSIPIFTGRPTPDGWYDQGADPETVNTIHDLADIQLQNNQKYFLEKITELSVRYLVISDSRIYSSYKNREELELIAEYPELALFKVRKIEPMKLNPQPSSKIPKVLGNLISTCVFLGIIIIQYKDRITESFLSMKKE